MKYHSKLLSEFLTEEWLSHFELMGSVTDRTQRYAQPRFVADQLVEFATRANFHIETGDSKIRLNDLLTVITEYRICNRPVLIDLIQIYARSNNLFHGPIIMPDRFLMGTFPGLIEDVLERTSSSEHYQRLITTSPHLKGGISLIILSQYLAKRYFINNEVLNEEQQDTLQNGYLLEHLDALHIHLREILKPFMEARRLEAMEARRLEARQRARQGSMLRGEESDDEPLLQQEMRPSNIITRSVRPLMSRSREVDLNPHSHPHPEEGREPGMELRPVRVLTPLLSPTQFHSTTFNESDYEE